MVKRELNEQEICILKMLIEAWKRFQQLDGANTSEQDKFFHAVTTAQNLIISRELK